MHNFNLPKRLLIAAIGGLAGFFVLLIARTVAIGVAVMSMSIFGESSLSAWGSLIFFVCVPILISLGAAIPAWALGSNLWAGLLSGVIAMSLVVFIHVVGNPNYSPFNNRETLEFLSAISVTVLISVLTRKQLPLGKLVMLLALIIFCISLKFLIPGNDIEIGNDTTKVGFLLSLFGWLLLPSGAAFITGSEQNS